MMEILFGMLIFSGAAHAGEWGVFEFQEPVVATYKVETSSSKSGRIYNLMRVQKGKANQTRRLTEGEYLDLIAYLRFQLSAEMAFQSRHKEPCQRPMVRASYSVNLLSVPLCSDSGRQKILANHILDRLESLLKMTTLTAEI